MSTHCCDAMRRHAENICEEHPYRFDCADCLIHQRTDEQYGIIIHDGGSSTVIIRFCPWCGVELGAMNGKGPRFAAMAIRHYIAVLEAARWHVTEDEAHLFDNDIGFYKSILKVLDADRWPNNA